MDQIKSLADVRPGDMYVGDISGAVGIGVALGEIAIGDGFRIGPFSARHVGIVTMAAAQEETEAGSLLKYGPRMAQAMPGGANIITLNERDHWTARNVFIRLPEDYPGQALDAAAIAVAMVRAGVGYSFLSYAYLALEVRALRLANGMSFARVNGEPGLGNRLEKRIDRRRPEVPVTMPSGIGTDTVAAAWPAVRQCAFPVEAICSVFFDQAWTLAGKQVMPPGTPSQVVTPGGLARAWFRAPNTVCGGFGLIESA